jgi:predicted dehydrogenase
VGEVHLDYVQRDYSRTCQVIGDEGTIRWDFTARETRLFTARSRRWKVFRVPADWEPNDMYLDELRHFLGCLARREKPAQDVFEAARVLRVALAARRSAVQGRFVSLS